MIIGIIIGLVIICTFYFVKGHIEDKNYEKRHKEYIDGLVKERQNLLSQPINYNSSERIQQIERILRNE